MKQFVHTVKDPQGVHAHAAGLIAKLAARFGDTQITLCCDGKTAKASARMKTMQLGIRKGSRVTIVAEGEDEDAAIIAMSDFFLNCL